MLELAYNLGRWITRAGNNLLSFLDNINEAWNKGVNDEIEDLKRSSKD